MLDPVLSLARPAVRALVPYSSARSLTTEGAIFLDANESPVSPFAETDSDAEVNRYPEPQPRRLMDCLSTLYGVPRETIFIGRGTDDAIDALVRTFCEAGSDSILVCPPTYGVYEVAARIQGARVISVPTRPEEDFRISPARVQEAWNASVKLIFLCSPNNPTGNLIPNEVVTELARATFGKAILVLDEAYIEFASRPSFLSAEGGNPLVNLPNVVVLRTLSKAWALAGARCGVAIGHPDLINLLQKVRAPYPVSSPSARVAVRALGETGRQSCRERIATIVRERERLRLALARLSFVRRVFPSEANYLLLEVRDNQEFMGLCRSRGIIVRDRSRDLGLTHCVRISIGTPAENDRLLDALGRGEK